MTTKQSESYDKLFDVLSKSYIIDRVFRGECIQVKNQRPIWVEEDGRFMIHLALRDTLQDMNDLKSGKITDDEYFELLMSEEVHFNSIEEVLTYLQQ